MNRQLKQAEVSHVVRTWVEVAERRGAAMRNRDTKRAVALGRILDSLEAEFPEEIGAAKKALNSHEGLVL